MIRTKERQEAAERVLNATRRVHGAWEYLQSCEKDVSRYMTLSGARPNPLRDANLRTAQRKLARAKNLYITTKLKEMDAITALRDEWGKRRPCSNCGRMLLPSEGHSGCASWQHPIS